MIYKSLIFKSYLKGGERGVPCIYPNEELKGQGGNKFAVGTRGWFLWLGLRRLLNIRRYLILLAMGKLRNSE